MLFENVQFDLRITESQEQGFQFCLHARFRNDLCNPSGCFSRYVDDIFRPQIPGTSNPAEHVPPLDRIGPDNRTINGRGCRLQPSQEERNGDNCQNARCAPQVTTFFPFWFSRDIHGDSLFNLNFHSTRFMNWLAYNAIRCSCVTENFSTRLHIIRIWTHSRSLSEKPTIARISLAPERFSDRLLGVDYSLHHLKIGHFSHRFISFRLGQRSRIPSLQSAKSYLTGSSGSNPASEAVISEAIFQPGEA